jgi:hypothetical protein
MQAPVLVGQMLVSLSYLTNIRCSLKIPRCKKICFYFLSLKTKAKGLRSIPVWAPMVSMNDMSMDHQAIGFMYVVDGRVTGFQY